MASVAPLPFLQRINRDQRPESEQVLNVPTWGAGVVQSTLTSLRTDRKIKVLDFHVRLRLTNGATGPTPRTNPPLLGTCLFSLIQQFTFRGTHLTLGAQTPIVMRGEFAAEYMAIFYPNWTPIYTVSIAGGTPVRGPGNGTTTGNYYGTASTTYDVDFVLPVPTFPVGLSVGDIPFYCIHGPDWPGNLYVDFTFADGSALITSAVANAPTITGYGGSGNATVEILTERALLSKPLMARIRPAVTFRLDQFSQPTSVVTTQGGTGIDVLDLQIGKDTTRIFAKTGTWTSADHNGGVVVYDALSDAIITRSFIALDNRQMGNNIALSDSTLQDYFGRATGRVTPVGYQVIDFIDTPGEGVSNPKSAFQSSTLTASRKFQFSGDVVLTATGLCDVMQEMLYGQPNLLAPASQS